MTIYEQVQLFILCGQEIDASWNFFVTIHIAIFGAFFLSDKFEKSTKIQIFIIISSYILFSIINLRAKLNSYRIYNSLLSDLKRSISDASHGIKFFIENYAVDDRIYISIFVHAIAFVFFILLFFINYKFLEKMRKILKLS